MISQETVKKLLEIAEVRELIVHLQGEYEKMDSISDIPETPQPPQALAVEVRARQVAMKKLAAILEPFLEPQGNGKPGSLLKEYIT